MSIKTEILTLQHIRVDLAFKMSEMRNIIFQAESSGIGIESIAGGKSALQDLRALFNEVCHELQTNTDYTRAYPALCAIGMSEDVKTALLGKQSEDNDEKDC